MSLSSSFILLVLWIHVHSIKAQDTSIAIFNLPNEIFSTPPVSLTGQASIGTDGVTSYSLDCDIYLSYCADGSDGEPTYVFDAVNGFTTYNLGTNSALTCGVTDTGQGGYSGTALCFQTSPYVVADQNGNPIGTSSTLLTISESSSYSLMLTDLDPTLAANLDATASPEPSLAAPTFGVMTTEPALPTETAFATETALATDTAFATETALATETAFATVTVRGASSSSSDGSSASGTRNGASSSTATAPNPSSSNSSSPSGAEISSGLTTRDKLGLGLGLGLGIILLAFVIGFLVRSCIARRRARPQPPELYENVNGLRQSRFSEPNGGDLTKGDE